MIFGTINEALKIFLAIGITVMKFDIAKLFNDCNKIENCFFNDFPY